MNGYPRYFRRLIAGFIIILLVGFHTLLHGADSSENSLNTPARHISLEGQPNFRDLGGYKTVDGRSVKWRQLFRTGELGSLSDADVKKLEELNLRTMVNFLLPEEIEKHGADRLPKGVLEIFDPISGERSAHLAMVAQNAISSGDFDKLPPEINPEIHWILMEEGKEHYANLLRTAADPGKRPLAFHCSHGIHRTGTGSAILLSALGVPWETVREDYLLTNDARMEENEATLSKLRVKMAESDKVAPESVDMTNVEAFYILEGSYIDSALKAARQNYGSMDAYIQEGLGLSQDEIKALRDSLLD